MDTGSTTNAAQILVSIIIMTILLTLILFAVRHSKRIHHNKFDANVHKTKFQHDDPGEHKTVGHLSHAQENLIKEIKVLLLFFVGFAAFIMAISRIINLTSNQAKNVFISYIIVFFIDIAIIRSLIICTYSLIRVYCCKESLIREKAEETVQLQIGSLSSLTAEDERFISSIRTGEHGYRRGVDDLDHSFRNDPKKFLQDENAGLSPPESFDTLPRKDSLPEELKAPERKSDHNAKGFNKDKDGLGGYLRGVGYAYAKGGFLDDEPTAKKRKVEGSMNSVDDKNSDDDDDENDKTK